MNGEKKTSGWADFLGDLLPEMIGPILFFVLIVAIPTVCWKAVKWNWRRDPNARLRRTIMAIAIVIGSIWIAASAVLLMIATEVRYGLDLKVTSTTDNLLDVLPKRAAVIFEWLRSPAISAPWWLVLCVVLTALLLVVFNQRVLAGVWGIARLFKRSEFASEVDNKSFEESTEKPESDQEPAEGALAETTPDVPQRVSFHGVEWEREADGKWASVCPTCGSSIAVVTTPRRGMAFSGGGVRTAYLQCSNNGCQFPNRPLNMPVNQVQSAITQQYQR